jgi:hypothetical protein
MADRSPGEIVANAREVLNAVRHAREDFVAATDSEDLPRVKTAVRNFLEQGRSVTWALQLLKGAIPDWTAWWTETRRELETDPICRWFYDLRNPIVKEGHPVNLWRGLSIPHISGNPPTPPRPEGAVGYAIKMDMSAEWHMSDGSTIPAGPALIASKKRFIVSSTPQNLMHRPLEDLMEHHIGVLEVIVQRCESEIGS